MFVFVESGYAYLYGMCLRCGQLAAYVTSFWNAESRNQMICRSCFQQGDPFYICGQCDALYIPTYESDKSTKCGFCERGRAPSDWGKEEPIPSTELGSRLQQLRKSRGFTLEHAARFMSDCDLSEYPLYESGVYKPSLEDLCKLADLFGVSTDTILGRDKVYPHSSRIYRQLDS